MTSRILIEEDCGIGTELREREERERKGGKRGERGGERGKGEVG